jgi:exopolysaccharide biosynthesis polyprenyl glycosylphosphotransferase
LSQGTLRRDSHVDHAPPRTDRARRGVARLTRPLGGFASVFEGPKSGAILRSDRIYRRALALADAVAALATLECGLAVTGAESHLRFVVVAPLVVVAVFSAKLLGLYDRDDLVLRKSTLDEGPAVFQLATLFALLVSLSDWQLMHGVLHSPQLLAVWLLMFVFTLLARWCSRHVAHRVVPAERCLIVGDASGIEAVGSRLGSGGGVNAELVGSVELDSDSHSELSMSALEETIRTDDIHRVVLAPRASDSDLVLDVVRLVKSLGVKVSLLPRLFEVVGSSVVFDDVKGITILGVRRFGLSRSSAAIKRSMDLAITLLALLALAAVIAVVAVAIRLDSHGPIFFRQTRVGRDGKWFSMLKFRSMVANADEQRDELVQRNGGARNGELFKLADDPRVTRVGRWLRRTSLDELPQLFNVLRGDMSLVGPRPLIVDEDALVQGWQRRRLRLTPGMTGPWQILGSAPPLNEMVNMDYLYIANWSLFTDVKIILRTVLHVAGRNGV